VENLGGQMKWFIKMLGFKSGIEKKKDKLKDLQAKAFQAQRNGNLRLAGKYFLEAENLETEIMDEEQNNENR
jgi:hypothetical protein